MLTCENCCYFWQEEYEDRPSCHWEVRCPGDISPCEEEDYYEDDVDETFYDPYMGCDCWED